MARLTVPIIMTPAPRSAAVAAASDEIKALSKALGAATGVIYDQAVGNDLKAIASLPAKIGNVANGAKGIASVALLIGGAFIALKLIQEGRKAFA